MASKSIQQQGSQLSKEEQQQLNQAKLWLKVQQSEGWVQQVQPFLMDRLNQSFPDPLEFKSDEDYLYAAKTASIFKKVVAELLQVFEMKKQEVAALEKKSEEGESSEGFDIGA